MPPHHHHHYWDELPEAVQDKTEEIEAFLGRSKKIRRLCRFAGMFANWTIGAEPASGIGSRVRLREIVVRMQLLLFRILLLLFWSTESPLSFAEGIRMIVDDSTSMNEDDRLPALKAGARLGAIFFDGSVDVFRLNGGVQRFELSDAASRDRLVAHIDGITANGPTPFIATLNRLLDNNTESPIVWISDGAATDGDLAQVTALAAQLRGPVIAVAVNTSSEAEQFLASMANVTGGSLTRVSSSQELTETLLEVAFSLQDYASYTPQQNQIQFRKTYPGNVILIGYRTELAITSSPPVGPPDYSIVAALNPTVFASRFQNPHQADFDVRATGIGTIGKLLRQGFVAHRMESSTQAIAGSELQVRSIPRTERKSNLEIPEIRYELRKNGRAIDETIATPSRNRPGEKSASLKIPQASSPSEVTEYSLRQVETLDDGSRRNSERIFKALPPKGQGIDTNRLKKHVDAGTHMANVGRVKLFEIDIPSKDESEISYFVQVDPLSGKNAIIVTETSASEIIPTQKRPATVAVFATIGNTPAGEYVGAFSVDSDLLANGPWKVTYSIAVEEPIRARFDIKGNIEPGRVTRGVLRLQNRSQPLVGVTIEAKPVIVGNKSIEFYDVPDTPISLPTNELISIPISVSVDPRLTEPSKYTTSILITRGSETLELPVSLQTGVGSGDAISISPNEFTVTGVANTVVDIEFFLRVTNKGIAPDQILEMSVDGFKSNDGQSQQLFVDFMNLQQQPLKSARLTSSGSKCIASILMPSRPGIYTGVIGLSMSQNGVKKIPLTLNVR